MNFRVSARTILHLGSELISSDGIAFYELIKNALDAGSPEVRVDVVYRLEHAVYDEILRALGEYRDDPDRTGGEDDDAPAGRTNWRGLRERALGALQLGAPGVDETAQAIRAARTKGQFVQALREANAIEIDDDGEGMSLRTLQRVYLTIGTSHRAEQKREQRRAAAEGETEDETTRVILGEKGLGRLSAMRLGDRLEVITGVDGAAVWNELSIDWNDFADAADADLESVTVTPRRGGEKARDQSGTLIRITALRSGWSEEKLSTLALEQFSKLVDPFDRARELPLVIHFNGDPVQIPAFATFLLDQAHGHLTGAFRPDAPDGPRFEGFMEYRLHRRRAPIGLNALDLESLTEALPPTLGRVGPFDLDVYWFNRRILTKIDGIGSLAVVRRILKEWAGGVSLYRDGYRVNPYGGKNDDWLDLDRDAYSTSGFKLNRGQIIGRVRITQDGNRYLIDQTNREGLKDNAEKRAFVDVLAVVMEHYRQWLVEVDRDVRRAGRLTAAEALERFRAEDDRLGDLLPDLDDALGGIPGGSALRRRLRETLSELRAAAAEIQAAAGMQADERSRVMHLASIGLMIEILAHELYRATAAGLSTISQARRARDPAQANVSLRVLDAQLRTLQKRLKVLDPLSTNARQTKEDFELGAWVEDIVSSFAGRSPGSRVDFQVRIRPRGADITVHAVKGMFVQVIENLLVNSVYWIGQRHRQQVRAGLAEDDDEVIGHVRVDVDVRRRRITVVDDGPGVPEERRERVFEPFFSTRPQKQGRGLGLYIAREIAEHHGGHLAMGEADEHGMIRSFIFELGGSDE